MAIETAWEKTAREVWDKLPKGKVYRMSTDLDHVFDGVTYDIGARWAGQRIRKGDYFLELGGPKHGYNSLWLIEIVHDEEKVDDGRVEVIGPEITELEEGTSRPFCFWLKFYGKDLVDEHLDTLTRFVYFVVELGEGWMLLNTRDTIWLRLNKESAPKLSFRSMGEAMVGNAKISGYPLIEKGEVKIITADPGPEGEEIMREITQKVARPFWERIDAKARDLKDDDVDTFYGCTVCQTFAPNHCCVIAPQRYPYCGILSWMGSKAMVELDPYGYVFKMPKGECIDSVGGEYSGVNETIHERSNRTVKRVKMYSSIFCPQTNCGCFEAGSFYIPEVDGLGIVDRRFAGNLPIGITFSKLAGFMSGGLQNHGYCGLGTRTPASNNFSAGDGGWTRVVWMPSEWKRILADAIPEEIYDKVATEEDTVDPYELKEFLKRVKHPIVERVWVNGEPEPLNIPAPGHDWPPEEEQKHLEHAARALGIPVSKLQGK